MSTPEPENTAPQPYDYGAVIDRICGTSSADPPHSSATGLWQFITMDVSEAQGEIRLQASSSIERFRALRELTRSRIRPGQETTGDAELALNPAADAETSGRSTLPDFEQSGTVTGRFEITSPPYHQTAAAPLTYDALADFMRAIGVTPQGTTYGALTARVETALAEARAMNLAFETGAEQCECGTWQVTWAPAYERWLCSDCADTEAERDHELDDAQTGEIRGVSAHLAVYDELARYVREDAEQTMRILTDNLPAVQQAVRGVSREQFIANYWRAGLDVVNPADSIRITGV